MTCPGMPSGPGDCVVLNLFYGQYVADVLFSGNSLEGLAKIHNPKFMVGSSKRVKVVY